MQLGEPAGDREPEPEPADASIGPLLRLCKRVNNLSANCSSNPTPESRTVTTACPAFCANDSSTVPPAGVNLMAFARRLSRICGAERGLL